MLPIAPAGTLHFEVQHPARPKGHCLAFLCAGLAVRVQCVASLLPVCTGSGIVAVPLNRAQLRDSPMFMPHLQQIPTHCESVTCLEGGEGHCMWVGTVCSVLYAPVTALVAPLTCTTFMLHSFRESFANFMTCTHKHMRQTTSRCCWWRRFLGVTAEFSSYAVHLQKT